MLETSVLDELTADACAAVTGRQDAAALLRSIEAANLFIVALDDDRTSYRYHHLVRKVLRTQLRNIDRSRELTLRLRAAEWLESAGDTRGATRSLPRGRTGRPGTGLAARAGGGRPWHDPAAPAVLDLSRVDPSLLTGVPERLLAVAADLLLWGTGFAAVSTSTCWNAPSRAIPPDSRLASGSRCCDRCAARCPAKQPRQCAMAWRRGASKSGPGSRTRGFRRAAAAVRAYTWLEDFEAVDREAATAQVMASVADPARLVDLRGAQALAWFDAGRLAEAAEAARAAGTDAGRLGSSSIPSQWITCASWPASRWSSATSTRRSVSPSVRCRYLNASGRSLRSSSCSTGPGSGRPTDISTRRWPRSTRHVSSWPGRNRCCWRERTS